MEWGQSSNHLGLIKYISVIYQRKKKISTSWEHVKVCGVNAADHGAAGTVASPRYTFWV